MRIAEGNGLTNAETVAVFFFSGSGLRVYMSAIHNPHRSGLPLVLCFANIKFKNFSGGQEPRTPKLFVLWRPPKF